ncbi:MAG: hypothetical protein ACKO3A_00680 [Opitutia bacterium]
MRTLLASLLLLGPGNLRAELSPDHYRQLQEGAAEALVLKIDQVEAKVTLGKDGKMTDVAASATVKSVVRSKSGLKPGDTVRLAYAIITTVVPMPGPSKPKVVEKGEVVRAYLNPGDDAKTLTPAAYGQSFLAP